MMMMISCFVWQVVSLFCGSFFFFLVSCLFLFFCLSDFVFVCPYSLLVHLCVSWFPLFLIIWCFCDLGHFSNPLLDAHVQAMQSAVRTAWLEGARQCHVDAAERVRPDIQFLHIAEEPCPVAWGINKVDCRHHARSPNEIQKIARYLS